MTVHFNSQKNIPLSITYIHALPKNPLVLDLFSSGCLTEISHEWITMNNLIPAIPAIPAILPTCTRHPRASIQAMIWS